MASRRPPQPRRKREGAVVLLGACLLAAAASPIQSESLTLSTYYPSPLGVYASVITTGGGAPAANTLLARDQGRVGVGTSAPAALLDVVGRGGTDLRIAGGAGDLALSASANVPWSWAATIQNTSGNGYGLYASAADYALYAFSGAGTGVYSDAAGAGAAAVYGYAPSGYGALGVGQQAGVYAFGTGPGGQGLLAYGPTAVNAQSWWNGGSGVQSAVSGSNAVAVSANNTTGSGWSGQFTGGQGLFADRIVSSGNNVPVTEGVAWTQPLWATNIAKPSCPPGYFPNIAASLDDTYFSAGPAGKGDWVGVEVVDSGSWCFFVWGGHCMGAWGDAQGWLGGCSSPPGGPWPPDAGMFHYVTYCSPTPFHRFGGCLHTAAQGPCP